jgi:hypothetical protein
MKVIHIELVSDLMDSLKRQLEKKMEIQKRKQPNDDYNNGWKHGSLNELGSILEAINTYFYEE